MPYRFANDDHDFSDFASGRVIYSQPGLPAFPVRLACEMFERALHRYSQNRPSGSMRVRLYDPCCGGAYHLAALGFRYASQFQSILASDADERALALARRNLGLLSPAGLEQREQEIRKMLAEYGKESHKDALRSAAVLRGQIDPNAPIPTRIFQANALDSQAIQHGLDGEAIDLLISDIPYGQLSSWILAQGAVQTAASPVEQMLAALRPALGGGSLAVIAADKSQKIAHPAYQRVERFQIGKRQVVFLQPI